MLKRYLLDKGFKKRYVLFAVLAMEIVSLPAAAGIISQSFKQAVDPALSVVLLEETEDKVRYVIASEAAFHIAADVTDAHYEVRIYKKGEVNSQSFGEKAQMPGAALTCSHTKNEQTTIFQSLRRTSINPDLNRDDILNQAVILEIKHNAGAKPNFSFVRGSTDIKTFNPINCLSPVS